jgi:putative tryptophan/tyrosine transport system substrate-binding protein
LGNDKVRAGDQSENRQADRSDDSAKGAGAGRQGNQVKPFWILDFGFLIGTSQNNKLLVLALSTLLLALSGSADAQQPVHLPRVGVLLALPQAAIADRIQAYQEGLRELGYFEGKTIRMDYRSADGKFDRLSDLARELVRLKVNVIVTGGPTATRPAKEATTEIPIVMAQDTDPVGNGFVASLARPAGNITGLSNYHPELSGKQLELLKEIIPRLARVAIVGNSNEPGNAQALKETEVAARALGLQPYYFDARDAKAIETVLRSASKERADAVLVLSSPIATSHRKELAEIAAKSRIPAMYQVSESVEAGGLMTYGVSTADLWRRAAIYVDKILKGRKPAELPVEQPTKFELVINLKTAKQIGLAVPQSVLARADKVIK